MKEDSFQFDYLIFFCVFVLICIGLLFIYEASANLSFHRFGDQYMYLKRQILFCILGFILMYVTMRIPLHIYSDKRLIYGMLILCIISLISLFFIGHTVNGATRWIRIGNLSFQPVELAKLSLCFYLSYSMSKKQEEMRSFKKGILPHLIIVGLIMLLILKQPDHGSFIMIGVWLFFMLFVGGANPFHLFILILMLSPITIFLFFKSPYIVHRWKAFLNPWKYADSYGFQIIHSLYAFGTGGIAGVGLGAGKQKLFYLPEPHTDFILAVIGEEIGFIGILFIICLYATIVLRGIKIAIDTRNVFNKYLAFGISSILGLQILINMGVVLNLIPAKGITLPFLSYGGSSLLFTMIEIGILLNISSKI